MLGAAHLVHNDIKPSNVFWKDRLKKEIVLGDYDCITTDRDRTPAGGTLLYMAPERIHSNDELHTNASDYCSMGLTLVNLLSGKVFTDNEIEDKKGNESALRNFLSRRWQRPVHCPDSLGVSPKTRDLLDRLMQLKPEDRYGSEYISSWIKNDGVGIIRHQETKTRKVIKGLRYKDRLILDIPEFIASLGADWEFGTFMLKQHKLDDFLRQFNGAYYTYAQEYAGYFDTSAGLFKLMQTISPSRDFYWKGRHYESLEDLVDLTETEELYRAQDPFCHFCRAGLLSFYEKNHGAGEDQIIRAEEIEKSGKKNPEMAVKKLQISLRQKPDFVWHGNTFTCMEDILAFLESNTNELDDLVDEFFQSKAAKVWLDYIGQGSFLSEVKKNMLNIQGNTL